MKQTRWLLDNHFFSVNVASNYFQNINGILLPVAAPLRQEENCMKKILMAVALTLVMTSAAFAANARNNVGCGLGTVLFGTSADNSILMQAFQATTNGTSGNQTFGITSGTSDCARPSNFVQNEKLINFAQANMDNLAKDIAMGKGETLDTFAEMLGVAPERQADFARKLQASFGKVFTSEHVVLAEVIDNSVAIANN